VNLKEGTRRLALLLGVSGALVGGFASYTELQTVQSQRSQHNKFEQLANSDVVHEARKNIRASESGLTQDPIPDKFDFSVVRVCPSDSINSSGCYTDVKKKDIKRIHWTKNLGVESIEIESAYPWESMVYPTPAPVGWEYLLIAIFPILGFLIPWGAIRAIGWVGAGFVANSK